MTCTAGEFSVLQRKGRRHPLLFLRARRYVHRVDVNARSIDVAAAQLPVITAEFEMRILAGAAGYRLVAFIAVPAGVVNRCGGRQSGGHKMRLPDDDLISRGAGLG